LRGLAGGKLAWEVVAGHSLAGGGAAPEVRMETLCLALTLRGRDAAGLAAALRDGDPPIVARIHEGRVLLDFRTLQGADLPLVAQALRELCNA
jgi:L-seryl-tRNA(Ser) seleniumtransferase